MSAPPTRPRPLSTRIRRAVAGIVVGSAASFGLFVVEASHSAATSGTAAATTQTSTGSGSGSSSSSTGTSSGGSVVQGSTAQQSNGGSNGS